MQNDVKDIVLGPGERHVVSLGPDHRLEYYFVEGVMWQNEVRGERSLAQPVVEALQHDPFERALYFAGLERR